MSYLEDYKKLIKDWFYVKRDPDSTNFERDELNDKINEMWKKLTVSEQFDANNYVLHLKRF